MSNLKTYVLFGKEAIEKYKMSLIQLLMNNDVEYKACSFKENELNEFLKEKTKWKDYIEIRKDDYLAVKKHFIKYNLSLGLPNPKFQFSRVLLSNYLLLKERFKKEYHISVKKEKYLKNFR